MQDTPRPEDLQRRRRLQETEGKPRFHPWTRAWSLDTCQLYWLPIGTFPIGHLQRQWVLAFVQGLLLRIAAAHGLEAQVFVRMGSIMPDYRDVFVRTAPECKPLFGLGRHPGRALPPLPDEAYAKNLQQGRVVYDPDAVRPEYVYWLSQGDRQKHLQVYLGSGGTTTLMLPPAPDAPEIRSFRLEGIHDPAMRQLAASIDFKQKAKDLHVLDAPFFKASKDLFAADLKDDPQYPGLLFTLPLLGANDVFAATPDALTQWFELFPVYLRESPEDRGMLLASAMDIEDILEGLCNEMDNEGSRFPG